MCGRHLSIAVGQAGERIEGRVFWATGLWVSFGYIRGGGVPIGVIFGLYTGYSGKKMETTI